MPSPRSAFGWLVRKEWRELLASRAWWAMVLCAGPLVGLSFISAVSTFAEVSSGAGNACGAVCSPLIGIWSPTFAAFEIVTVFLLPFVAIRVMSGDRQSGSLKLEVQRRLSSVTRIGAKVLVLLAGCLIAGLPAIGAVGLWMSYGGNAYLPEVSVILFGHLLNAGLTIAVAMAVTVLTDHPSTAAIVTLAMTIGTWIVDIAAAVNGGMWERLARYTPSSMVALFQHGLVQTNVVLIVLALTAAAVCVAAIGEQLDKPARWRALAATAAVIFAGGACVGATFIRGSWDASEARQNSFPEPAEEALERLSAPLAISVHLAPQDPRRQELERVALSKLRRVVPRLTVTDVARTSSGLYESADPNYGEITYETGGRTVVSRVVTEEGALEAIFEAANLKLDEENEALYRGHALVAKPAGAAVAFYGMWPVLVVGAGVWSLRRQV